MNWRDLLVYWRGKCLHGRPPGRSDLQPVEEIPSLLPHLFLIDIVGDHFRFRLLGTFITSRAGRDSTGRFVDEELMPERELQTWLQGLQKIARHQRPLLAVTQPSAAFSTEYVAIALPLVGTEGATEMIFGGLFDGNDCHFARAPDLKAIHGLIEYEIPANLNGRIVPIVARGTAPNQARL